MTDIPPVPERPDAPGWGMPEHQPSPAAPAPEPAVGAPGVAPGPPPGPPPGYWWVGPPPPPPPPGPRGAFSRILRSAVTGWAVAAALALAVAGLSVALVTSGPSPGFARFQRPIGGAPFPGGGPAGGPGRGGFFGGALPANLAVAGTVTGTGSGTFTVLTPAGQTVTVNEQASTTYSSPGAQASASSVVKGARVAVEGTRNGDTVTATRIVVLPDRGFGGLAP